MREHSATPRWLPRALVVSAEACSGTLEPVVLVKNQPKERAGSNRACHQHRSGNVKPQPKAPRADGRAATGIEPPPAVAGIYSRRSAPTCTRTTQRLSGAPSRVERYAEHPRRYRGPQGRAYRRFQQGETTWVPTTRSKTRPRN